MSQAASRRSSSNGPCPRRTSSLASEWAAKRQAKIEAAQARKLARENGEMTEQHTFRPNTGRGPPSMARVPVNTVPGNTARRVSRTSSSGSTASGRRMGGELSTPLPVAEERVSQLPSRCYQSFESDDLSRISAGRLVSRPVGESIAQDPQVDTAFTQNGARSCIHERVSVAGREQIRKRSVHEHSPSAALGAALQYGDDPWLLSQGTCSDTTSTTATGFHVMLASSGTLSIASSHSMQGSSCSALDTPMGLLASSSQHFPIVDFSDGEESEETILDLTQAHGDRLLKQCSSGSLTGESLFLNSNAASSSVKTATTPISPNDSSLAAAVAAAVSAFGNETAQRDDIRQELRNPSWRRSSGSLERRAPSFECVIATKESLRQDAASETESLELEDACGADNSSTCKASGFSWDGIATEVEDHVLSGNGQSGSSRSPFRLRGSLAGNDVGQEMHLDSQIRKCFLRRQECVIDGMGIGQSLANSGGCITLESMKAALAGTSHDSFFHWFSNLHLAPGVVEVALFDFGAALKDFYLQEQSEPRFEERRLFSDGRDLLDKKPIEAIQARAFPAPIGYESRSPEAKQETCDEGPEVGRSISSGSSISESLMNSGVQPLPSMAPMKREDNVVLCPWREAPLRREEVLHPPAISSSMAPSIFAEAQESGSQIEFVDEDAKRKWRSERVESLERKCQELEEELGVAKRAQLFLQNELLTSHPRANEESSESETHTVHDREVAEYETTSQERRFDLPAMERSASPVEYGMIQYEQIVPPQAFTCSSTVGSDHSRISSTRFGNWTNSGTEETGTTSTSGDKPSSQFLVRTLPGTGKRLLLSPVAEDPYREETAASSDEEGGDVLSHSGKRMLQEDNTSEMQRMSEMWDRVLSLGKTVPEVEEPQRERDAGEIKSLNSLLDRLSALMEKRPAPQENARRCREQLAQDTDCSPEPAGSSSSWLPRTSSLPKAPREAKTMRATVPKLFGAPFNNCPPPPQRREEQTLTAQDRLPSPRDAPLISPRDMRLPSPRERSAQSSPRDVRMARNVPMYSPRDASLPSPRDLPPESPRDVRQPPRSRPPPSPREVPLLCTSILPQLR